ncbi:MAG: tyrosine-type recombinase/integrase [Faecalibacterium sp.]|nr:tyrosine-type recombinase/integrase [Faecalibacterium sp.]
MHDDVCQSVNDYLHYLAVIKGRSLQTVFNYYIDLRDFYQYIVVRRGLCSEDKIKDFNWHIIDTAFIRQINSGDIFEFLYMMQRQKNTKATTRNRKLSALRGYFKYLLNVVNQITVDPTANIDNAKTEKVLPKYLTADQSLALLKNVQSDFYERDFCILTLFLNCGMRLAELVRINISDIADDLIRLHGKGNKERMAYLTPACQDALLHYLRARAALPNISPTDRDALFISKKTGKRLSPRRVEQIVERCLQSAGLSGKGYSPHKLRHTAATLMYQTGEVDVLALKELLGHANVSTTQIYTHINEMQLRQATSKSPLSGVSYMPQQSAEIEDN